MLNFKRFVSVPDRVSKDSIDLILNRNHVSLTILASKIQNELISNANYTVHLFVSEKYNKAFARNPDGSEFILPNGTSFEVGL